MTVRMFCEAATMNQTSTQVSRARLLRSAAPPSSLASLCLLRLHSGPDGRRIDVEFIGQRHLVVSYFLSDPFLRRVHRGAAAFPDPLHCPRIYGVYCDTCSRALLSDLVSDVRCVKRRGSKCPFDTPQYHLPVFATAREPARRPLHTSASPPIHTLYPATIRFLYCFRK